MDRGHYTELVILVFVTAFTHCVLSYTCEKLVGSSDYCSCELKDNAGQLIGTFDVHSLDKVKHSQTPLIDRLTASDKAQYSYNPCTAMRLGTSCDGVAACQHVHDSLYNLGTQDSVEYSVPSLGTVVLTYKEEVTTDKRSSIVTYKCNCDADSPILLALGETSPLKYEYKITSMHACVQACPPKEALSTGGILCIIFFVLVFVYFVGGILINKFVLKRENGRDLIPNVEFWSDLPYLIKDGFLFAISPCKKQNAYDQI